MKASGFGVGQAQPCEDARHFVGETGTPITFCARAMRIVTGLRVGTLTV